MTIRQALHLAQKRFKDDGIDIPRRDIEILLEELTGLTRAELYLYGERPLSLDEERHFLIWLEDRVAGCPVQYLLHKAWFMGLELYVDQSVLIPRQDTEILVESVISAAAAMPQPLEILDIGTGSGAIAISLAKYIDTCTITATDISHEALAVARKNVFRYGFQKRIVLKQGDLFEPVADKKFDIIVSNPPYIPSDEIGFLQPEIVLYEPRIALDGGDDGLSFYRRFCQKVRDFLKPGGLLALEIGYNQASAVKRIIEQKTGLEDICVIQDLACMDRVVMAKHRR